MEHQDFNTSETTKKKWKRIKESDARIRGEKCETDKMKKLKPPIPPPSNEVSMLCNSLMHTTIDLILFLFLLVTAYYLN